jgi:hypothetical protein
MCVKVKVFMLVHISRELWVVYTPYNLYYYYYEYAHKHLTGKN